VTLQTFTTTFEVSHQDPRDQYLFKEILKHCYRIPFIS